MIVLSISYGNDCPAPTSYIRTFFETAYNYDLQKNDIPKRHTILLGHFSE
jgi:hypothetical protein